MSEQRREMTEPHAVARATDPETSWDAADSVKDIRKSQEQVLKIFRRHGPLSDEAMIHKASIAGVMQSHSGLRTRRNELVTLGLLKDSGRRGKTMSNRSTTIWELTS
jgi:hypothetical protein